MENNLGLFIIIKRRLLWIYQQKMGLSPYTQEMFKVKKNMLAELMQGLLCVRQTHYIFFRNLHHFVMQSINSVYHVSESISNLRPRIRNFVSDRLKEPNSISSFKNEIKRWQTEICPSRLCKTYNPGQNIWYKVKKSSKIGQDFKNLLFNFACFLTAIVKV